MNSKIFQQRARDCFRLAQECPDLYAREALEELAAEFRRVAKLKRLAEESLSDKRARNSGRRQRVTAAVFAGIDCLTAGKTGVPRTASWCSVIAAGVLGYTSGWNQGSSTALLGGKSARMLSAEILLYVALGFVAQLVDGALGMAYGLIATSFLLASGTPPALASASVHTAEIVTTGLAGASHVWNRNIDWSLFKRLAPAGIAGGVLGAYVLVGLPENAIKAFVTIYLIGMAFLIARRILLGEKERKTSKAQRERSAPTVPLGVSGGFFDAIGGGGWGPIVTSTLIARGDHPRQSIGSVSLSEFFVTLGDFACASHGARSFAIRLGRARPDHRRCLGRTTCGRAEPCAASPHSDDHGRSDSCLRSPPIA